MATRATFARLTENLRKFRKANVIFFKKGFGKCVHFGEYHLRALGKYNEYGENGKYASMASICQTAWQMSVSLASLNIFHFLGILYSPYLLNLPNFPHSPNHENAVILYFVKPTNRYNFCFP